MKITEFVKKGNIATFSHYRQKHLYYTVPRIDTSEIYQFTIPIEDLAEATVERIEQALTLMRYIRLAMETNTLNLIYNLKAKP